MMVPHLSPQALLLAHLLVLQGLCLLLYVAEGKLESSQGVRQRNSSLPLRQLADRKKSRKTALDLGDLFFVGAAWELDEDEEECAHCDMDRCTQKSALCYVLTTPDNTPIPHEEERCGSLAELGLLLKVRSKPGSSPPIALNREGCQLGVCWCKRSPPALTTTTTQPEHEEGEREGAEDEGGDKGGEAENDEDSLLLAQHPAAQVNSRLWQASSRLGANSTAKGVLLIRASRFRGLNNLLFNAMAMEGAVNVSEGSTAGATGRGRLDWVWRVGVKVLWLTAVFVVIA